MLIKCPVTLFRESVGEAGTVPAGEAAEQQAAVDMSMVSTGKQWVMITVSCITIEFVLNHYNGEYYYQLWSGQFNCYCSD